jgi:hypothetical protein
LYTLTDATGRESQRVERGDRIAPAFFDFGLMVQTVDKEKVESQKEKGEEEKKGKIWRLPVLEGICKYAAEHVLLVGRLGSGRATALARLLLQEAENALGDRNANIPVLVELLIKMAIALKLLKLILRRSLFNKPLINLIMTSNINQKNHHFQQFFIFRKSKNNPTIISNRTRPQPR